MTKAEVKDAIAIAKANGNVRLAALLANVYRDVLAQADPQKPRVAESPINGLSAAWDKPRVSDYVD